MATLLYGDCLEKMKGMADKSIDLIICDLPFGCLTTPRATIGAGWREVKKNGGIPELIREKPESCSWDVKIDLELFWKEIKRIRKNDHTPCLMFCNTKYGFELIKSNEKEYRYDLVWSKSNAVGFLSANKKPMSSHEMIYVFSKAGAKYNRIDLLGDYPKGGGGRSTANFLPIAGMPNTGTTVEGKRCIKSVIEVSNKKEKGGHPTAKPIGLYKFLIERYSDEGATVLDPTFGSCNSGIASIELQRRYVGIEKDNKFYWKAVNKIV
jgi:site-specific DNA-methyltransferase (adenine-specific)